MLMLAGVALQCCFIIDVGSQLIWLPIKDMESEKLYLFGASLTSSLSLQRISAMLYYTPVMVFRAADFLNLKST